MRKCLHLFFFPQFSPDNYRDSLSFHAFFSESVGSEGVNSNQFIRV